MGPSDFRRQRPEGHRGDALETSPQHRNDESWVEVASQPSSSSLSSIGDDIVTTGLRVGNGPYAARRRRPQQHRPMPASFIVGHTAGNGGATSSQEEYDETESEEDMVMTSSTEAAHPSMNFLRQQTAVRAGLDNDTDSDDDENATALGRPTNSTGFRPQPNAFSHPPSHLTHRHSTTSAHQYHPSQSRPSMSRAHTRPSRGGPHNILSPSYQADNDAALRASLTTLLSCAAAARGLSKGDEMPRTGASGPGVLPSSQPMELRLVPESELMSENPPPPSAGATGLPKAPLRTASNSSAPSAPSSTSSREREQRDANEKNKRAASGQTKPGRATKKKRTGLVDGDVTTFISPTLIPWVVGAGVVVLISVVGFGAGYVIGREVGRQENSISLGSAGLVSNSTGSCGSDLVRSTSGGTLRRFRWGAMGKSVAA
ncbi:hypothetical protein QBC43DRAFT_89663 [Cladorrhinum sp. PSN259]|nr:hypothetical protein QBC43DRAFT_89663 [Cladorrhinum sp. PSN259]